MNNVVPLETPAAIEQHAREWVVRIDREEPLSEEEKATLREWMARSPSHAAALKRFARFWDQASIVRASPVELAGRQRRISLTWAWPTVAWAAGLLLALAASLAGYRHSDRADNGLYRTALGQQKTIALADGSSVQLNTDSQVQVAYNGATRTLRLLRGEALFSVKPNPHRPFEVHAGSNVVRAVGTAFAVHLEGNQVEVTVTKGVVDVDEAVSDQTAAPAHPVATAAPRAHLGRLTAGQVTHVGGTPHPLQAQQLNEPELQRRMAWQQGYLLFSGEPLSDVVAQVNRYSPVALEIADPHLNSIAIGGRFRVGDLDAVLEVLRDNFGIASRHIDEHTVRLDSASVH